MSNHRTRTLMVAGVWAAIVLAGLASGWLSARARRSAMLAELMADAERSALALNSRELEELAGSRADLGTPAYAELKQRLRRLQSIRPTIRFVYVFRRTAEGGVIFLGDSAEPGAGDESLPGDEYPQAPQSPGLQEVLRTGQPATEGPLEDDFGAWVTAYAATRPLVPGAAEPPREVLGLDVDAANWRRMLLQAGAQGAFYAWVILGLPFLALIVSRRQGEQREVIRNLSEAMEQSHSAILIIDLNHRIEFANRGLCQQTGFGRRELIGRQWREFHVAQPGHDEFSDLVATIRAGRTWEGEWRHRRKDGSTYPVRGVVTPVRHRDSSLACFVAVFDDVTEAKRREAELREARDRAEAGDRAKGQFLATMSHEVRTPLNGIVGFTSLLMETSLTAEQREYVQTIRMSTEALIHLTGDILDFARIESGKLKLELAPYDPRDTLEEALELLAGKAAEKHIELLHQVADDVPAAILVDGSRLRQVLVNLIGNAIKFTEQGQVAAAIKVVPGQNRPEREAPEGTAPAAETCVLEFSVRDSGIGIPADQHVRLFKPFSQVDETTTRRYGGTGLGLAICRNLVRMMDGDITVASSEGAGSTFTFTIAAEVAARPVHDGYNLDGMRVALVIQPGALQAELAKLLQRWHAIVVEAREPGNLAELEWDAALVNVDEDLARKLVAQTEPLPGLRPAKVAGLVPVTLPSELRLALRTHFHALINKPVRHAALFALLADTRTHAPIPPALTHFGYRVLVVEDNVMNQRLMERVLLALGCVATVVGDGRRAVEELTARAESFDLVLLDLHMPEMDGLGVLAEVRSGRAGPRAQTIWIVAVTADARPAQRESARQAGINDYVVKPVSIADMEAAFRRYRADRATRRG